MSTSILVLGEPFEAPSKPMALLTALKHFLENGKHGLATTTADILAYKKSLTPEERTAATVELNSYGYTLKE